MSNAEWDTNCIHTIAAVCPPCYLSSLIPLTYTHCFPEVNWIFLPLVGNGAVWCDKWPGRMWWVSIWWVFAERLQGANNKCKHRKTPFFSSKRLAYWTLEEINCIVALDKMLLLPSYSGKTSPGAKGWIKKMLIFLSQQFLGEWKRVETNLVLIKF